MNPYLKKFLHRGLLFGGFGTIIVGIVYAILDGTLHNFSLGGDEVFISIISTYLLAFVHAGASVFNQIEHWSVAKSLLFHFSTLYAAYLACYLINTWISFDFVVVAIFSAVFVVAYFAVWMTVYFCMKATEKKLNAGIRRQ
jgi:hypothetical protein